MASALLHLTKHRGSVLDTVEDDEEAAKDSEKTKAVLGTNAKLLAQGRYVCELQLERLQSKVVRFVVMRITLKQQIILKKQMRF